jgi:hypothetical protein
MARITAATERAALADRLAAEVLASAAPVASGVGSCATGWIVAGQASEGGPDVVVGNRGLLGERLVELTTHNGAERVQHVVTPMAAASETLRGLPELGRRVLEDPCGDDLMNREMQLSVDCLAAYLDLGRPVLDRLPDPRVLRRDQQPPVILVPRVQERDIHVVESIVSRPEQPPGAAFSVVRAGSVATR